MADSCSCHKTLELHDKRHREIMSLVQRIRSVDGGSDRKNLFSTKKSRKPRARARTKSSQSNIDEGVGDAEQEAESWIDLSTLGDEDGSSKIQEEEADPKTPQEKKQAKEERKLAKHQANANIVTELDLTHLDKVLHPDEFVIADRSRLPGQGLIDNEHIERNIVFNGNTYQHRYRQLYDSARVAKEALAQHGDHVQSQTEEENMLLDSIMLHLGIDPHPAHATKSRKSLSTKLRAAIRNDLHIVANDEAEMMQRMAGYWRYVNRRTYNAMIRMNELWDWATGEKLPEIEEENEESTPEDEIRLEGPASEMHPQSDRETKSHAEDKDLSSLTIGVDTLELPNEGEDDFGSQSEYEANQLVFQPGRSPGPTLPFTVPSPSSSDDLFDGELSDITSDGETLVSTKSLFNLFATPRRTRDYLSAGDTPKKDSDALYQGEKDVRVSGRAVRPASPTKRVSAKNSQSVADKWTFLGPRRNHIARVKARTRAGVTAPKPRADPANRFGTLKNEIAAPREEDEAVDPVDAKGRSLQLNVRVVENMNVSRNKENHKKPSSSLSLSVSEQESSPLSSKTNGITPPGSNTKSNSSDKKVKNVKRYARDFPTLSSPTLPSSTAPSHPSTTTNNLISEGQHHPTSSTSKPKAPTVTPASASTTTPLSKTISITPEAVQLSDWSSRVARGGRRMPMPMPTSSVGSNSGSGSGKKVFATKKKTTTKTEVEESVKAKEKQGDDNRAGDRNGEDGWTEVRR